MKLYISADIEGITGIGHWDETDKKAPGDYTPFQEQMTAEVAAVCEAAISQGVEEILVKDAHDSGRNLILDRLPEIVKVVRGWAGNPSSMVQELDNSFDAAMFIGYHSRAGAGSNPLSHTLSGSMLASININGKDVSEFYLHAMLATRLKVPVVLVSGDRGLCDEVAEWNANIRTVPVLEGIGNSVVTIHPRKAVRLLHEAVRDALNGDLADCLLPTADRYTIRLNFKRHQDAYRASWYPGAKLEAPTTASYEHDDFFEIMRFIMLAF